MDEHERNLPGVNVQNNVDLTQSSVGSLLYVQTDVANIHPQTPDSGSPSKDTPTKKSINNFRQPPNNFVTCKTFTDIKEKLKNKQSLVLGLHGFPGSGKTAIVRKLAAEFPFKPHESTFVKYQIECSDSSEDIQVSLKALLQQMRECNLVRSKAACKNASEQLEKKRTAEFVEVLAEAAVPIFIAIEDPPETDRELLCDLASSIASTSFISSVYVCITSNSKQACNVSGRHEPVHVCGLSVEEGLKFLGISPEKLETEQKAARQIITDLGGFPLGLLAVKATCRKSRKNYARYFESRSFNHQKETTHLKEEEGTRTKHIYQAVATLLGEKGIWESMKILSFFHHGGIPQRLIGIIKQMQRNVNDQQDQQLLKTCSDNEDESGEFISRLEDFAFCEVKGTGYEDTKITLHQVAFQAVRIYMKDEERIPALKQAVRALSSVVHKDLRKEVYEVSMRSMIPHLQSVLDFFKLHKEFLNDFVTLMAVSHLREVYGCAAVFLNDGSGEVSLLLSARMIWVEVCKRSGQEMNFDVLVKAQNQSAENVAESIVEACVEAGKRLKCNEDCLDKYIALVTQFKDDELLFLSDLSKSPDVTKILKVASERFVGITPDILQRIRLSKNGGTFLDTAKHHEVFFVDRLASVMYSLGRLTWRDKGITPEKRVNFSWITDMTYALCEQCSLQTSVKLLFLRLSAISRVNVRLENSSATKNVAEKRDTLIDTRNMAESNLDNAINQTSDAFYENGLRKCMQRNIFDKLSSNCAIVRINATLHFLCSNENRAEVLGQNADLYYEGLLNLAKEHIDDWKLAAKCLVYCGKYMASFDNFAKAIEHFQEALSYQAVANEQADLFPWVWYNYARATVVGRLYLHKEHAISKCYEALHNQDDIAMDLSDNLHKELVKLESL